MTKNSKAGEGGLERQGGLESVKKTEQVADVGRGAIRVGGGRPGVGYFCRTRVTPKSGWRRPAFIQQRSDFNPTSV
jgi:hypothetical protein